MAGTETITLKLVAVDLLSGNVTKAISGMDKLAKRGGLVGSVLQGVGQSFGQMLNPMSLATRGVGMLTDYLFEGVRAAVEDEKATARLTQTITANVKAWDGSLDAVNAAIKAGARLAFSDDEVRAGLNQLIPRTHSIAEANRLNALAMDLARAKSMDLGDAAGLVGKAYSGQTSALRRAGIAIKNTKNSTAALAELQSAVAGQAETYAQTTEGSMEALNIQVAELNETVGYLLLPTFKELVNFANDTLTPAIDNIASHAKDLEFGFHLLTEAALLPLLPLKVTAEELSKRKDDILGVLGDTTDQANAQMKEFQVPAPGDVRFFDPIVDAAGDAARGIVRPLRKVAPSAKQSLEPLSGIVKGSVRKARKQAERDMADLKWALTHPMEDKKLRKVWRDELHDAYAALHKAQKWGNATAIAKAQELITSLKAKIKELDSLTFSLTGEFHIGSKGAAQLKTYFSGLGRGNTGHVRKTSQGQDVYKAAGGPVKAGESYIVGERGPERLTMGDHGGYITPNHRLGGGGGANIHVHFHGLLAAPTEAETARIARAIGPALRREMAAAGL